MRRQTKALCARKSACKIACAFWRVARNQLAAFVAKHIADAGEEQAQVVVDFGAGADGGAVGAAGVFVRDGDGGRNAVDPVGCRLIELFEELPRVGGEAFDVTALAFGIECVERHARFAAPGDPAEDDELSMGQVEVDLAEVVYRDSA